MKQKQILVLPFVPPSANHSHIHARGRVFPSKQTRQFRDDVAKACEEQAISLQSGPLKTIMYVCYGRFKNGKDRPGDINNSVKQMQDALNKIAWDDDSQIDEQTEIRRRGEERGIELQIMPMQ